MFKIFEDETIDELNKVDKQIIQKKSGFRFAVDAVLVANFLNLKGIKTVLDIGTGTGIIPILLSNKNYLTKIYGVEIQKDIADMAQRSIKCNNLENKIKIINQDIRFFKNDFKVDLVVSNPPYMKVKEGKVSENEQKAISRHEITLTFEELVKSTRRILKSGGSFNIVHRIKRFDEVISVLKDNKFYIKRIRFVYSKPEKDAILFMLEALRDRKCDMVINEPIYLYDKNNEFSTEVMSYYN